MRNTASLSMPTIAPSPSRGRRRCDAGERTIKSTGFSQTLGAMDARVLRRARALQDALRAVTRALSPRLAARVLLTLS